MDFDLDEELTLIRDMARDFAEQRARAARDEARPRAPHRPREVFDEAAELGLCGLTVPEELRRRGLGNLALARRARGDQPRLRVDRRDALGAQQPGRARRSSSSAPRRRSALAAAARRPARSRRLRLTEPNAGSDAARAAARPRATATSCVLNGTKIWVTNGSHAGLFIVYARTDAEGTKGITRSSCRATRRASRSASTRRSRHPRLAARSRSLLDGVRVPADEPARRAGQGLHDRDGHARRRAHRHRGQAVGIARPASRPRSSTPRSASSSASRSRDFQAIQWKLADMSARPRRRAPAHAGAPRGCATAASRARSEAAQAKLVRRQPANFCADEACRSTAAPATPTTSTSSASSATRASPRSTRARPTSSAS